MMLIDNEILFILAIFLLLILVVIKNLYITKSLKSIIINYDSLKYDLNALCRGARDIDSRIEQLDNRLQMTIDRMDKVGSENIHNKEYENAIRAIKNGATYERLINIHGLTHVEAKLLVSLHGAEVNAA